jgi:SH3-like domain-containing protein
MKIVASADRFQIRDADWEQFWVARRRILLSGGRSAQVEVVTPARPSCS